MQVLEILAKETDLAKLTILLPEILALVREQFNALKNKDVPLEELVVRQTLAAKSMNTLILPLPRLRRGNCRLMVKPLKEANQ